MCFIRNTVDVNAQMVGNASADVFRGKAFFHSRICWLDVKLPMVMTRPPVVASWDPTKQYALQCGAITKIFRVLQLHHSSPDPNGNPQREDSRRVGVARSFTWLDVRLTARLIADQRD